MSRITPFGGRRTRLGGQKTTSNSSQKGGQVFFSPHASPPRTMCIREMNCGPRLSALA